MMCRYACVLPSTENAQNKDASCGVRVMVPCSLVCLYECFGGTYCRYLQGHGEVVGSMSQHVDPSQKTKIRIEIKSIKSKLDPWTCFV
jgi:hypothetical protein